MRDKIEIARKNGYTDAEIAAHLAGMPAWSEKIAKARESGYGDAEIVGHFATMRPNSTLLQYAAEVPRQIGLTARYAIEGATALPNMAGDALGLRSSEAVSNALTKAGVPQPQGAQERVVGDVSRSMAGQMVPIGAGVEMARAAPGAVRNVGQMLASRPGAQMIGAASGAASSGIARESGAGPAGQTVAGLLGGVVAPIGGDALLTAGRAATRGLRAAIDPFTQTGRDRVIGSTLNRVTTDRAGALARLENAAEQVPGSRPTTAQAARDEGLLITERGLASSDPRAGALLSRRASEQNTARNALLNTLSGDDAALEAAKAARDTKAGRLYRAAEQDGIDPAMADALKPQIKNLVERMPKGVMEKAKELARVNGETFDEAGSVRGMHWLKMAVDDAIDAAKKTGVGAQTQRGLIQFKNDLLSVMDDLSPNYANARATYAGMSKPINQMETLQDVRGRVLNAGTDAATGERIMSAGKFYNAVTKNEAELAKVLTKDQMANLKAIGRDLDAAALSASSGRAAGSNTTQNISTAYVIGSAIGDRAGNSGIVQNLARPLTWLNKLNEKQLQELLTDAMLNPVLARGLMQKATPRNLESLGLELKQRAIAMGLGGQIATTGSVGRSRSAEEATQ